VTAAPRPTILCSPRPRARSSASAFAAEHSVPPDPPERSGQIEARELTQRYGDSAPLLEASAVHPGRSARSHLRSMAATHNIKTSRVSEVGARPDLPPLRRTDRSSRKKEPMTIPTNTPNQLDNPPVIRPQRRSKR